MPTYDALRLEAVWRAQYVPVKAPKRNGPLPKSIKDRITSAVIMDENGCWLWQRYIRSNGYGQISVPGSNPRYVHRVAYEAWHGSIPDGLQIDHLCRVRHCCNPDHLEVVTCRENLIRGTGPTAKRAATTHCPAGHPYNEKNTYIRPGRGGRDCRRCKIAAHDRWRQRQRVTA